MMLDLYEIEAAGSLRHSFQHQLISILTDSSLIITPDVSAFQHLPSKQCNLLFLQIPH